LRNKPKDFQLWYILSQVPFESLILIPDRNRLKNTKQSRIYYLLRDTI
jgi:hypothetical protein